MKECEKALVNYPMLGYTNGSDTQFVIRAQEDGFRSGWRAALEWWGRREVFGKKAYYSGNIRFTDIDVRVQLMKEEFGEEKYEGV